MTLASALVLLLTLLRALRWRVPGVLFLAGVPLATWTGHGLALGLSHSQGHALLLDAAGVGWGVLAAAMGLAGVAFGQLVGIEEAKLSFARSLVPAFTAGMAALLLGVQGWADDVGLVGAAWFLWFGYVGVAAFLGGIRYDSSARHHAGRVLLGFTVVSGTVLLAVALDHVVVGLSLYGMEGASDARRAVLELDALYLRSGVRKMSYIAVVLSLLLAGSASQGSMMPASDMRGSMSALFALGGLLLFAVVEGWLSTQG